jgi:Flp pilus assembly protein TadD
MIKKIFRKHRESCFLLILVISILVVFWNVKDFGFLDYDDDLYVTRNIHVLSGITFKGLSWAFTTNFPHFWMPLTWFTFMLDHELFGLNPGGYHLVNLLFHILSTLLLFLVLKRMTGAFWRSFFVAALFALHPLHVESVAWIAERKDVLSTFFWMLVMWFYVLYVERPVFYRYLPVLLFFIFGLMSKPMLVTLPFVLLLLDYWPLKRFQIFPSETKENPESKQSFFHYKLGFFPLSLVWEKLPLFAAAFLASIIGFFAQETSGGVVPVGFFPLKIRIANAFLSYVKYIGKMIWPFHLSVFYPHPGNELSFWFAIASAIFLVVISLLVLRLIKDFPPLSVGWFWYLGTLVPVIGLVQVGAQAMADRFTYIPLIGLFIMISWGAPDIIQNRRYKNLILSLLAGIILVVFTVCSWFQVQYWQNSITLFQHAVDVTGKNFLAHYNLAIALSQEKRDEEAIYHFKEALKIEPYYEGAYRNLGRLLAKKGKLDEAISYYREAVKINPRDSKSHQKLGILYVQKGEREEAFYHFQEALSINPNDAKSHNDLGIILGQEGKLEAAVTHFQEAIRIEPGYAEAYVNLGVALNRLGRPKEAISSYDKALKLNPDDANAHFNLGVALAQQGSLKEAVFHFREVLRINPEDNEARKSLNSLLKIMEGSK